jgi:hypothetical protein
MTRALHDWTDLSTDDLLQRGIAAARVGDTDDAAAILAEVTDREPENADAWLWRAGVERDPTQKRRHFERVLALRPGDAEAQAGLDRLAEKYGAGVLTPEAEAAVLHCTWHPDRETRLRCNRCNRPMCTECAVQHPVGLRCKECVKETRSPIYKVSTAGYVWASLAGLAAGTLTALPVLFLGGLAWVGWLIVFVISAGLGAAVGEMVGRAAGRKRGKGLVTIAAVTMVAGVAVVCFGIAAGYAAALGIGRPAGSAIAVFLANAIPIGIYLVIGIGAAAARLR